MKLSQSLGTGSIPVARSDCKTAVSQEKRPFFCLLVMEGVGETAVVPPKCVHSRLLRPSLFLRFEFLAFASIAFNTGYNLRNS
jgi:hypothetical protein